MARDGQTEEQEEERKETSNLPSYKIKNENTFPQYRLGFKLSTAETIKTSRLLRTILGSVLNVKTM